MVPIFEPPCMSKMRNAMGKLQNQTLFPTLMLTAFNIYILHCHFTGTRSCN